MDTRPKSMIGRATLAALAAPVAAAMGAEGSEGPSLFTGDLGNILWSLVTFIVVLIVLGKFAWKPILGALQKREDFIRDSLKQAKKDREDAESRLKEYERRLQAAREEASSIVAEGRRDAEVVKQKIEADAKTGADAMVDRAKREIQLATDTAVKELYTTSAKLATDIASRIIRKELDADDHERLIGESIDDMQRLGGNGRSTN